MFTWFYLSSMLHDTVNNIKFVPKGPKWDLGPRAVKLPAFLPAGFEQEN
jgi:hypothetical protein